MVGDMQRCAVCEASVCKHGVRFWILIIDEHVSVRLDDAGFCVCNVGDG